MYIYAFPARGCDVALRALEGISQVVLDSVFVAVSAFRSFSDFTACQESRVKAILPGKKKTTCTRL